MNKSVKQYISLFLLLSFCLCSLSGCYSMQNLDDLAFVVALGIDKGKNDQLMLSFQIAIPGNSGGGEGTGSEAQSSGSIVNSIECSSIDNGINLINSYISKKVNLSHCKVIVISEELAELGIENYIYTLINKTQVRPDCNIIISRCTSQYFLENSKPILEKLSARYYEIAPSSSEYTGYTDNVTLGTFFSNYSDTFGECYAILGGVNSESTHKKRKTEVQKPLMENLKQIKHLSKQNPILKIWDLPSLMEISWWEN